MSEGRGAPSRHGEIEFGLSTSEEYVVMLLFVVLASSTVAAPVILNLILGSRAAATLTTMKEWLVANNATVMSVLFVVTIDRHS